MIEKKVIEIDSVQESCEARRRASAFRTGVSLAKDITLVGSVLALIFKLFQNYAGAIP